MLTYADVCCLLSGVEREKDARIALGLPAFGWDHKGLPKILDHLGIPACLVAPHTEDHLSGECAYTSSVRPHILVAVPPHTEDHLSGECATMLVA